MNFNIYLILPCTICTHALHTLYMGLLYSLLSPRGIIIILMYNVQPYFSLKDLGKKCALNTAKYGNTSLSTVIATLCIGSPTSSSSNWHLCPWTVLSPLSPVPGPRAHHSLCSLSVSWAPLHFTSKRHHTAFLLPLTLSIMSSRSIHAIAKVRTSSFLWLNDTCMCITPTLSIHLATATQVVPHLRHCE